MDDEFNFVASGNGFTEAFVKVVKDSFGMDDTAQAVIDSNHNASIQPIMNSVPGLQHRTPTG